MSRAGLTYHFSRQDLAFCEKLARRRNDSKDRSPNYKIDPKRQDFEIHLLGIKGEYAVARWFGVEVDKTISAGGDDGLPDITLPDGRTVEVKTRGRMNYEFALITDRYEDFVADVGILVLPVSDQTFELFGWVDQKRFRKHAIVRNFTFGPRLVIEQQKMRPMWSLLYEVSGI